MDPPAAGERRVRGPGGAPGSPAVWGLGILGVLALAYLFRGLALPLFLSAALAYLLHPLVAWADALAIRRSAAVAALYLAFAGLLLGGGLLLGPRLRQEATSLASSLPAMVAEVDDALEAAAGDLRAAYPPLGRLLPRPEARRAWIEEIVQARAGTVPELLEHAGKLVLFTVLVPFFAFFLLRDSSRIVAYLMDRLPAAHIETTVAVWWEIDRLIGRYLRGLALDGLAVGALVAVGLRALGVPYELLLGSFAGLANAVPVVGPLLSAAVAALVALTKGLGVGAAGQVLLLFLLIKLVDDTLIQPLTIGRSVHLHPVLLLASVVAGSQALGILGMVLAVPAVTVLQEVTRLLLEHRRIRAGALPHPGATASRPHLVC